MAGRANGKSNGKVKVALLEERMNEAFRHVSVLNEEMGKVQVLMSDCKNRICSIEVAQQDMQAQIDRRFNANDFWTKICAAGIFVGVVGIILELYIRSHLGG